MKRRSIRWIFMVIFTAFSTLPIAILGVVVLYLTEDSVRDEINKKNLLLSNVLISQIEKYLEMPLEELDALEIVSKKYRLKNKSILIPLFEQLIHHNYFVKFILTNRNGYVTNVWPFDDNLLKSDISRRDFFKEVSRTGTPYWSSVFISSPSNIPATAISVPFNGGVLSAHLDLSQLSKITDTLAETEDISVSVTDQTGTYIFHSAEQKVLQREIDPNYAKTKELFGGDIIQRDMIHDGIKYICHIGFVEQTGWSVMISQPYAKTYLPVKRLSWLILAATLFVFLFSSFCSFRYASVITKTLNKFLESIRTIADGQYDTKLTNLRYNEFIEFANSVSGMAKKIQLREKTILESQAMFQAVFNAEALGTSIVDLKGRYQEVNDKWTQITGYTYSELSDHTNMTITHPDDQGRMSTFLEELRKGVRTSGMLEKRIIRNDGTVLWVDHTMAIIKEGKEVKYLVGMLVDNTFRKQAEEERRQLENRLQQAYKMEAVGSLAGGIAHDFNNILAAIFGYAEMARDDSKPGSSVANDLDKVLEASNRAKRLVEQILAFSRQADTESIPFNPANIAKEALKMLRPALPTTIEITQDIDSKTGLIFADPTKINQILMNLCTNAFHAMEEKGGKLSVILKKTNLSTEDLVHEPSIDPGHFAHLTVSDSGTGISPEIKKKIFDPYFTTKEVGRGTGMGLSIIHGIVKSYGGFITVYSELGVGSVFHIYLPLLQDKSPATHNKATTPPLSSASGERVLFVDDEELLTRMGKEMLEKFGYLVTTKNNGLEALKIFQEHPDQFDIVITDQTMPGMTGADLAENMIKIRPDISIILCTGYSNIISKKEAESMGIKEFALKPLTKKDLLTLVRKVLNNAQ